MLDWDTTSYPGEHRAMLFGHALRLYPARGVYQYQSVQYPADGLGAHVARMLALGAPSEQDAKLQRLYRCGMSVCSAAAAVGMPANTAFDRLRRFGLTLRVEPTRADLLRDYLREHGPTAAGIVSEALCFNATRAYQNVRDVRSVGTVPRAGRKGDVVLALVSDPKPIRPRSGGGRRTAGSLLQNVWR